MNVNKNVKLRVLEKRRKKHECYLKKKKSELNKLSRNAQLQKQANIINNELSKKNFLLQLKRHFNIERLINILV